jgi:hypothetical protein
MGTWDSGPFDNDHAADFASYVHTCSDPAARHDLLAITFGAFMDMADDHEDFMIDSDYQLPSIILEVTASAAFVADAVTGRRDFTETPYAMEPPAGADGFDIEVKWVHADLGTVPLTLSTAALMAVLRAYRLLTAADYTPDWTETLVRIRDSLTEAVKP